MVGYSGGAKYLFPGISGGEFLHAFHWLGAVVTCAGTIGIKHTPVREVINRAMDLIDVEVSCLAMVVKDPERALRASTPETTAKPGLLPRISPSRSMWSKKNRPTTTVFGVCPPMYDEIWTGGKVMYKLEQVVADGGRLIIYAPHITEVSRTWGADIERIGYHIVDFFLAQPEQLHRYSPRGAGPLHPCAGYRDHGRRHRKTADRGDNRLRHRPLKPVQRSTSGYLDPDTINPDDYRNREA